MAPCAEQTTSWKISWVCATAHPACPPCDPRLHIDEPSINNLPNVADNIRVHPHMKRTVVRASRSVLLIRVVHQASLPLEFVTSRGLSLMLTSRRKVHAGFTIG